MNIDVYTPGTNLTGHAAAPITAKRFVKIAGNRHGDGNLTIATATAAGRIAGVARDDADTGELAGFSRGSGRVVRVTAGGPIAAFAEVEVGPDGKAVTHTAGVPVGYAVTAAAANGDAEITLN